MSELHSTFPRNFWAKKMSFSSLCQILQAWVVKTVFYVSRGTFCGIFSQNHIIWQSLWAKKFSRFCQNCILLFRGTFEQNNSQSRHFGFYSSPCQILQAWVAKTVFYVSRGTFCGICFHRIILNGTVSEKIQLVLSKLHSTFPGNFWAKQFSKSSIWFLFQSLPDSSSMGCQNCLLRVQRHLLWNFFHRIILIDTVSEKKFAGFVRTAFYFSAELLSKKNVVF